METIGDDIIAHCLLPFLDCQTATALRHTSRSLLRSTSLPNTYPQWQRLFKQSIKDISVASEDFDVSLNLKTTIHSCYLCIQSHRCCRCEKVFRVDKLGVVCGANVFYRCCGACMSWMFVRCDAYPGMRNYLLQFGNSVQQFFGSGKNMFAIDPKLYKKYSLLGVHINRHQVAKLLSRGFWDVVRAAEKARHLSVYEQQNEKENNVFLKTQLRKYWRWRIGSDCEKPPDVVRQLHNAGDIWLPRAIPVIGYFIQVDTVLQPVPVTPQLEESLESESLAPRQKGHDILAYEMPAKTAKATQAVVDFDNQWRQQVDFRGLRSIKCAICSRLFSNRVYSRMFLINVVNHFVTTHQDSRVLVLSVNLNTRSVC